MVLRGEDHEWVESCGVNFGFNPILLEEGRLKTVGTSPSLKMDSLLLYSVSVKNEEQFSSQGVRIFFCTSVSVSFCLLSFPKSDCAVIFRLQVIEELLGVENLFWESVRGWKIGCRLVEGCYIGFQLYGID